MVVNKLIKNRIYILLNNNLLKRLGLVRVKVLDGPRVIISGKVSSPQEKINAEIIARSVVGILLVVNKIVDNSNTKEIKSIVNLKKIKKKTSERINIKEQNLSIKSVSANKVAMKGRVDQYWKKIRAEECIQKEVPKYNIENRMKVRPHEKLSDREILNKVLKKIVKADYQLLGKIHFYVNNGLVFIGGRLNNLKDIISLHNHIVYTKGIRGIVNKVSLSNI